MVCRDIGVSPKECIMFEDSFKNLKTCVSVLGMGGVFVAGETLEMELSGKTDARTELDSVANVVVPNPSAICSSLSRHVRFLIAARIQ